VPKGDAVAQPLKGRALVPGSAEGIALVAGQPLSFWGGLDAATGEIIDRRHPRSGAIVTGRVLVLPAGKGSSTASAVLLDAIRAGTAPVAIILLRPDPILALGSIVADEMYGRSVPVVVLPPDAFATLCEGDRLAVHPDGSLTVSPTEGD